MATISMAETLAEATRAIESARKNWREYPLAATKDLSYARAMLIRAQDALNGEIEIAEKIKTK